jgi:hypothetical protein
MNPRSRADTLDAAGDRRWALCVDNPTARRCGSLIGDAGDLEHSRASARRSCPIPENKDRTVGICYAVLAHRSEQHAGEFPVPPTADHQEICST